MTQPSEEQLEQVRGATARLLPSLDLETVRESQVVEMVEGQVGFLVRDDPVLRGELQTAIDSFLLEGAPAPAARPASSKRKRPSASLKDFVVDDDASDEDYAAGDDEEDDEWDEDEDDEGDGEADGASRRTKTASKRPAAAAKSTKTNGGSGGGRWNKEEWSAAREKWSEPPPPSSATDASATATGAPGALSDDKLALALTLNPAGSTAKDLASVLGASKSDVNKALYRMHAAGKAIKSEGARARRDGPRLPGEASRRRLPHPKWKARRNRPSTGLSARRPRLRPSPRPGPPTRARWRVRFAPYRALDGAWFPTTAGRRWYPSGNTTRRTGRGYRERRASRCGTSSGASCGRTWRRRMRKSPNARRRGRGR